jgi:hypothetical protein
LCPGSRIVHLEGRSTGIKGNSQKRLPDYWFQARRRFFLKNHGALYTALAEAAFPLGSFLWGQPPESPTSPLRTR